MYIIFSTGSNLGDRVGNLKKAKDFLKSEFSFLEESRIYESPAVDYLNQPDFLNQVLAFEMPQIKPHEVLDRIMEIEASLGRTREIDKGPRTVDIDLLFWGNETISSENLDVPHPRLFERSFIVEPLKELKIYKELESCFHFTDKFDNECWVFNS